MKLIKSIFIAAAIATSAMASVSAFAQSMTDMTVGEIRKIDKDAGKVTIKHGEIKNLEMPPMTMVFAVKKPALLDKIKAGDKVKFNVIREDGKIVVTDIQSVQ
ncbi:MAG: copper-binding protein [Burkholderiales bacterium]|nr:copper-binding protein [Burkholderiales bacterium]